MKKKSKINIKMSNWLSCLRTEINSRLAHYYLYILPHFFISISHKKEISVLSLFIFNLTSIRFISSHFALFASFKPFPKAEIKGNFPQKIFFFKLQNSHFLHYLFINFSLFYFIIPKNSPFPK